MRTSMMSILCLVLGLATQPAAAVHKPATPDCGMQCCAQCGRPTACLQKGLSSCVRSPEGIKDVLVRRVPRVLHSAAGMP